MASRQDNLSPEILSAGQTHIAGLDGLRGVTAFAVFAHHIGLMRHQGGLFSHAYLAVDFLFLLSGFVIALAYEPMMARSLTFKSYVGLRLGRLYPMILVGAVAGFAVSVFLKLPFPLWLALIAQLLLLPFAVSKAEAYPLNNVQWSLFFELLANFLHAAVFKALTTPRLFVLVGLSALWLIFTDIHFHGLAVGFTLVNSWGGLARVAFSYSAGLLVCRMYKAGRLRIVRIPYWAVVTILTVLLAVPTIPLLSDSAVTIFILPTLLVLALRATARSRMLGLAAWAGAISYPLYAIHVPLLQAAVLLIPNGAAAPLRAAYWALVVVLIVAASWATEYLYDSPIRRWLRRTALAGTPHVGVPLGRATSPKPLTL
jgi:peptidoglycan/LPS O-acetylase OafA/YrhL